MTNDHTLTSMRSVNVRIYGRVQGIGFRAAAQRRAVGLGLSGWVRNRDDGSVELVAVGARQDVGQLMAWCNTGPAGASVSRIEVVEAPGENFGGDFEVRPTA